MKDVSTSSILSEMLGATCLHAVSTSSILSEMLGATCLHADKTRP